MTGQGDTCGLAPVLSLLADRPVNDEFHENYACHRSEQGPRAGTDPTTSDDAVSLPDNLSWSCHDNSVTSFHDRVADIEVSYQWGTAMSALYPFQMISIPMHIRMKADSRTMTSRPVTPRIRAKLSANRYAM